MNRTVLLIALATLLVACDDGNKTNVPGKDAASASVTAAVTASATASAAAAEGHDCGKDCGGCGEHAKHEGCGDCAKHGGGGHDCGEDCGGCDKGCEGCKGCDGKADHEGCDGKADHEGCDECGKHADCQCAAGKKGETVWCDKCNAGFVDGKKLTDKAAFDAAKAAKK